MTRLDPDAGNVMKDNGETFFNFDPGHGLVKTASKEATAPLETSSFKALHISETLNTRCITHQRFLIGYLCSAGAGRLRRDVGVLTRC